MSENQLKRQISALVDDELCDEEKKELLLELTTSPDLQKTWFHYHLIRSVLQRKNDALLIEQAKNLAAGVKERLLQETHGSTSEFDATILSQHPNSHGQKLLNTKGNEDQA
jgi:negative regulator of sigma E activity